MEKLFEGKRSSYRNRAGLCDRFRAEGAICINSVRPGAVLTPMVANALEDAAREATVSGITMGRLAEPEEISRLVVFLASDDASYITGAAFVAGGGMLAR